MAIVNWKANSWKHVNVVWKSISNFQICRLNSTKKQLLCYFAVGPIMYEIRMKYKTSKELLKWQFFRKCVVFEVDKNVDYVRPPHSPVTPIFLKFFPERLFSDKISDLAKPPPPLQNLLQEHIPCLPQWWWWWWWEAGWPSCHPSPATPNLPPTFTTPPTIGRYTDTALFLCFSEIYFCLKLLPFCCLNWVFLCWL